MPSVHLSKIKVEQKTDHPRLGRKGPGRKHLLAKRGVDNPDKQLIASLELLDEEG